MPKVPQETHESTELQAQYAAQVAADLERNNKEQDRLSAELTALQAQLQALQQDQSLLVSVQQALDHTGPAAPAPQDPSQAATVPAPRPASAAAKPARRKKAATPKPTTKKTATGKAATGKAVAEKPEGTAAAQPTLGTLIHELLSGQSEPRSAAEITTALAQAHPERGIKTTVVRTTVEGLVAKGRAERTKQGTSVFYTTTHSATQTAPETAAAPTGSESVAE
ncbi:hypothetical protein AB5J56_44150 [Streptomyces sp. R21]|uniref:Regulatory protein n=1 Tax=Streptomyces sp. R21 TaxID=3238627 RepID=A0AB39PLQ4_9ACTN